MSTMFPWRARAGGERRGSLTSRAYRAIRSSILGGALPLGSPVSGRGLARRLGMSLLPVAQALKQLEGDGLVESRPRAGTVVRKPTREDIIGHYVVREALETQSARLFAEKATVAERRQLRAMARAIDALRAGRVRAHGDPCRAHAEFHHRIAECARCPELLRAIEKSHILVMNWLYNSAARFHASPRRWHSDLAAALSGGDADAADRKMRGHVRFGMETVLRRLATSGMLADSAARVTVRRPGRTSRFISRPTKKSARPKGGPS